MYPDRSYIKNFHSEESRLPEVILTLDSMDVEQLASFSRLHPIDLNDYSRKQQKWIQDSVYFLGIDTGRLPKPDEIADKILSSNLPQRFRAFYALMYPDRVIEHENL